MTKNNKFLYLSMVVFIFQALQSNCQIRWIMSYYNDEDAPIECFSESYDHGYILSGKHGANYSEFNWLLKTNINGEILWEKTIGNGVNSIALHDLNQDNSGNIYLGGSTKAYDPEGDPLVLKLNSCGEKEWCRIFYTENNHDFSSCFTITPEGNIVSVLLLTNPEPWVERICLAKLSSEGDLIWKLCYTTSDTSQRNEDVFDIIVTPDSGFLITGFCYYEDPTVPNKWWVHPYYLKTDSLGNFEWETVAYKETELEGGIAWSTVVSPDGQYFYSSISHYYHEEDFASPSLLKMNMEGNILAIYDIVYGYENGKLSYAQFVNDSTLAAEAAWGNTVDSLWSTAVILDTLGNLLNSTILTEDQFTSILDKTYDGKLVYASNIYMNDQFDVILTKLNQDLEQDTLYTMPFTYDSLCPYQIISDTIVQDDCGLIVGIEEQGGLEAWEQGSWGAGEQGSLVIWPNPATEGLSVKVLGLGSGTLCSLVIYDIFGRIALSLPPGGGRAGNGGWQVDVSALPPGIYIALAKDDGSVIGTAKFVVAR